MVWMIEIDHWYLYYFFSLAGTPASIAALLESIVFHFIRYFDWQFLFCCCCCYLTIITAKSISWLVDWCRARVCKLGPEVNWQQKAKGAFRKPNDARDARDAESNQNKRKKWSDSFQDESRMDHGPLEIFLKMIESLGNGRIDPARWSWIRFFGKLCLFSSRLFCRFLVAIQTASTW